MLSGLRVRSLGAASSQRRLLLQPLCQASARLTAQYDNTRSTSTRTSLAIPTPLSSPLRTSGVPSRSFAGSAKPGSVYDPIYNKSIKEKDAFWLEKANDIDWTRKGKKALSDKLGPNPYDYRWFADGWETNACFNMLDKHINEGRGERDAIIYDSPVTGVKQKFTYNQLKSNVSKLAGALAHAGVKKGDRVLLYMPMIPQAIEGMLATSRLGAIHSVVFGGFAAAELAKRIMDAQPTVILTASCGIESPTKILPYKQALDEAIKLSKHNPNKVLIWQRPQLETKEFTPGRDEVWSDYVAKHGKEVEPTPVAATDPLYVLYTSGTTGMPKGVVRDVASIVAVKASMSMLYRFDRDRVWWSASDVGWVVGHSYIVYGPLLQGGTTLLYEGKPVGTPDAGGFWRVIEEYKVQSLYSAPTALRAIKKEDPEGKFMKKYDLSKFDAIYLAGERADPATLNWARHLLQKPIYDQWWQTETGWPIVANPVGIELLPVKDGSAARAAPGWNVQVLDDDGHLLPRGKQGNLVIELPLPPSALHELWKNPQRFKKSYMDKFPGYYDTADAGRIDEDGYVYIMARSDDVMNVAGHRLSSGQMEEVLADHPSVAESAVIAVPESLKGHIPVGLVVLKGAAAGGKAPNVDPKQLEKEIVSAVRARVGAVACFKKVIIVPRLPKTRSGKVLRNVLRAIAEGKEQLPIPPTIEDESVVPEIKAILHANDIGHVDNDKILYADPMAPVVKENS